MQRGRLAWTGSDNEEFYTEIRRMRVVVLQVKHEKLESGLPALQKNAGGGHEKNRKILFVNRNRNCFLQKNELS